MFHPCIHLAHDAIAQKLPFSVLVRKLVIGQCYYTLRLLRILASLSLAALYE